MEDEEERPRQGADGRWFGVRRTRPPQPCDVRTYEPDESGPGRASTGELPRTQAASGPLSKGSRENPPSAPWAPSRKPLGRAGGTIREREQEEEAEEEEEE